MRFFGDGFGEQTTLVKSHIAGWCTNQAAHGMAFHVFAHVKANQFNTHDVGQLLGGFGFAHASRTTEQECTNRLINLAQTRASHFHAGSQHVQSFVLPKHHTLQIALQSFQLTAVVVRHIGGRNARNFGNDFFHLGFANDFFAFGRCQDALCRTCFVNHINRFVWQMAVIDVFGAQFRSSLQSRHGVFHVVVLFKARFQALQYINSFGYSRFNHINFLETTRQCRVFFKDGTVFGERGCAYAFELTRA